MKGQQLLLAARVHHQTKKFAELTSEMDRFVSNQREHDQLKQKLAQLKTSITTAVATETARAAAIRAAKAPEVEAIVIAPLPEPAIELVTAETDQTFIENEAMEISVASPEAINPLIDEAYYENENLSF